MSVNATEPYSWNSGVVSRGFERCVLTGRHGVPGKNALEFLGAAALGRQPGVDMLGLQINDAVVVAGSGDVGGIGFEAREILRVGSSRRRKKSFLASS